MAAYVIYLDVLFFLNFSLDFLLLAAAGRFLRREGRLLRLLGAALLGGLYGAAMVFPGLALFYTLPAALVVSLLLLLVAYPRRSWGDFLRLVGVFYLVAFAMAGSVLAAMTWLSSHGYVLGGVSTVRWAALIAALPVAIIVSRRGYRELKKIWQKEDFHAELEIHVAGRSCRLHGLIDTGNDLSDPLSHLPVIVADVEQVLPLAPARLRRAWLEWESRPDAVLQELSAVHDLDGWVRRLRLIPFASIGKRHGTLLAFRPDQLILHYQGQELEVRAMVALSRLGREGCQAVLNPQILNDAVEPGKEIGA